MKPSYSGFKTEERKGFLDVPPVGCYEAEILNVRVVQADGDKRQRDALEMFIDITEGEFKGRYMELWNNQKERFGDNVSYKGIFRLNLPQDGDEPWRMKVFQENMWCLEQSNKDYAWDWDEKKLKGLKIGINVRKRLYTYNGKDRETTEICQFETIEDVRTGKCKPRKDRDNRENKDGGSATDSQGFTDVSAAQVDVPW